MREIVSKVKRFFRDAIYRAVSVENAVDKPDSHVAARVIPRFFLSAATIAFLQKKMGFAPNTGIDILAFRVRILASMAERVGTIKKATPK